MNSKIAHLDFFLDVWVYIELSVNYGYDVNANMLMFMQLWSPTVIHLSLSKTYRLKKLDPQQQLYPQKNLLECFLRWLNQLNHAGQWSNWTFDTCPQKHDVTENVVNKPFTTLQQQFPALKFQPWWNRRPTLNLFKNSLYKLFVVLYWQSF